jgi:hypothetical protein
MPKLLLFLLLASVALASPILTLQNTGLGASMSQDLYWTVNGGHAYVTDNTGFPFVSGAWTADSETSKWISPRASYKPTRWPETADTFGTDAPGDYVYVTHFDLTGLDPATAWLSFIWAVDNTIADVKLNGLSINHVFPDPSGTRFAFSSAVSISSGFRAGINVLEFDTVNGAGVYVNPAGLRVEFTSNAVATPEPASLPLIGAGLLGLAFVARRRR